MFVPIVLGFKCQVSLRGNFSNEDSTRKDQSICVNKQVHFLYIRGLRVGEALVFYVGLQLNQSPLEVFLFDPYLCILAKRRTVGSMPTTLSFLFFPQALILIVSLITGSPALSFHTRICMCMYTCMPTALGYCYIQYR